MVVPSAHDRFVREWLVKAKQDLTGAGMLLQTPGIPDLAAFHAQQAMEKALKAYLSWHQIAFQRTHNLTALVQLCMDVDPSFQVLASAAQTLSQYAVDVRYPGAFTLASAQSPRTPPPAARAGR